MIDHIENEEVGSYSLLQAETVFLELVDKYKNQNIHHLYIWSDGQWVIVVDATIESEDEMKIDSLVKMLQDEHGKTNKFTDNSSWKLECKHLGEHLDTFEMIDLNSFI